MNPIDERAFRLLRLMVEHPAPPESGEEFEAQRLQEQTELSPQDLDDAIDRLETLGAVEVDRPLGTAPFRFQGVSVTSRGRWLYHEMSVEREPISDPKLRDSASPETIRRLPKAPLNPVGSPYGFTDEDWETVSLRKSDQERLYVAVGMKFESSHYDTDVFLANLNAHFQTALGRRKSGRAVALEFKRLGAGYGEHLFNEIARDIIGADIAVFETSDLAPNVMLEMGVALTWGVRVLPMKKVGCPQPPSDISGQTWIEHDESCAKILDLQFDRRLVEMIDRVLKKKTSHLG